MSDIAKAISNAVNTEEISAILHAEGNAEEKSVPTRARTVESEPEPEVWTRTEIINGREFQFEAASELELERMVNTAIKTAVAVSTPVDEPQAVEDPAKAAMNEAELELRFKNGSISAKEYLEKSGAIRDYLERQGVPVEELKNVVAEKQDKAFAQSWEQATAEFLNSPTGSDWPGGEKNRNLMGLKIAELGLVDAEDKVAALAQAYQSMKQTGMIFDGAEVHAEPHRAVQSASEPRPVRTQAVVTAPREETVQRRTSSSIFGASSGASVNDMRDSGEPVKVNIPPDASPQAILEAWKQEQIRQGIDPNVAFTQQFSGRR